MPRTIRVLLVDDDPVFTTLACELLKALAPDFTCQVVSVADGLNASGAVRNRHYDLALLDYHLPGATGLDVLAEIQALPLGRRPAVIMLTGSGNESVAVEAMKRGAKDYLTKADLDLPSLMRAVQSALNQKRLAEQVEAYHSQLEADLDMARKLQQSLLPQQYPTFPHTTSQDASALKFQHRFFSTTQLAGDFFNVQALSDNEAGVLICDVMGHGVRSALVTAMLRALVGELTPEAGRPDLFLAGMNRRLTAMLKQTGDTLFATAFYAVVDVEAGRLRYARAGHPPPLHARRATGVVERLPFPKGAGPALGLFEDATFVGCEREITGGDLLLLFTDGLFEVTGADGEEYGEQRLLDGARQRMGRSLAQVLDEVVDEVRRFAGDEDFSDDVCLLGVEVVRSHADPTRQGTDEEDCRR